MATFKVVVRKKRADGFYPVYIRVVHRSRMGYIKTDKLITDKQITKNGEIKDIVVKKYVLVTMQQSSLTVWPLKDMNVMLRTIAWL